MTQLIVPDMGGNSQGEVIEILIREGENVEQEQSTLVLESEKATIEVPANAAGTVKKLLVSIGDKFSGGEAYAELDVVVVDSVAQKPVTKAIVESAVEPVVAAKQPNQVPAKIGTAPIPTNSNSSDTTAYAGPAVRKLARELGVELQQVTGTGLRGRIQKEDVQQYVKQHLNVGSIASGALPTPPEIDFSQFGPIHTEALNSIKRATAKAMTVANLNVPQVTQFDEADITELEAFRVQQNQRFAADGLKFSLVPFVLKALARCLRDYPEFNSSLHRNAEQLILKDYVHIGVAVDTPKGLLVPVLRNIDNKTTTQIHQELQNLAEQARSGKLSLADMQGGGFSLSSLGGIGGAAFTPIVNPPEVAILGLSKARMQPYWNGSQFVPRLMLPLSLSYDHRVIDGAQAARFSQRLVAYLQDIRQLLM